VVEMLDHYVRDLHTCDMCGGTGAIPESNEIGYTVEVIPCPQCNGEGYYL